MSLLFCSGSETDYYWLAFSLVGLCQDCQGHWGAVKVSCFQKNIEEIVCVCVCVCVKNKQGAAGSSQFCCQRRQLWSRLRRQSVYLRISWRDGNFVRFVCFWFSCFQAVWFPFLIDQIVASSFFIVLQLDLLFPLVFNLVDPTFSSWFCTVTTLDRV